jgi:hypothetical protein
MHHPVRILCGALLALGLLLPKILWAMDDHAEMMLIPGRVLMNDKNSYASVVLKNHGHATGNYSVELVDLQMLENGNVVPIEQGQPAPYSALPYLHVVPRSMSLKPNEIQKIQLVLHKPPNLEDGEYRAHLKVRLVDENADGEKASVVTAKSVTISVKAHLVMIIPVIFRHGETSYTMQIDSPKLSRNASGIPIVEMYLVREGNRSSMGDISITHIAPDGKSQLLVFYPGVPVYRGTPRRFVSVPLQEIPKDVNLSTGSLKITYATPEDEQSKVLAETALRLP